MISHENDCPFLKEKKKKKSSRTRKTSFKIISRSNHLIKRENNEYSSKGEEEREREEQNVEIAFRERVRDLPTDHRVGSSDQTAREFYTL